MTKATATKAVTKTATVKPLALIVGSADITKAIEGIQRRGRKLDTDIQQAALSCIAHAGQHGDITLCNRLLEALPKGARQRALIEWFLAFGNVAKNDAKGKDQPAFVYDKTRTVDVDAGRETPWYEMGKQGDTLEAAFDLRARLASLLKQAKAAQDRGQDVPGLDALTDLHAKLSA